MIPRLPTRTSIARIFAAASFPWLNLISTHAQQPALLLDPVADGQVRLRWARESAGFVLESAAEISQLPNFTVVAQTPVLVGNEWTVTLPASPVVQFFRLRQVAIPRAVTIAATSPTSGEGGVAVTRETVIRFTGALADNAVLNTSHLFAEAAGRRLLTRAEMATDRRGASLFYQEPLPGAARVVVTLDGTDLRDAAGLDLDADGDGVPGGVVKFSFETMNNLPVGETAVVGRVLASEKNPDGTDRPLAQVTVTVDGQEESLRTVTAADGTFVLRPAPAGRFFVHVDGRTALGSTWPAGAYYPFVGKAWEAVPGKTNNLAGGNGVIYLPLVPADALQAVSAVVDTRITFTPSVLAENPALAGVEIVVPADALFADSGARGGRVGIAPVPANRLPERLPEGLNFPLVITIQTDGPSNFDRPVPVKFPNLPDPVTGEKLPPGAKTALWSFNHDTGRWEIQGPMTISADGLFAVSDPGVGVLQPGWHGVNPGNNGGGPGGPDGPGPDLGCKTGNCDDSLKDRPIGDCFHQSAKVAKGAISFAKDLLELPQNTAPFSAKKCGLGVLEGAANATFDCMAFDLLDGEKCKKTFVQEGIGTGLGCLPWVGGLSKLGWNAYLLRNDYIEAAAVCKKAGGQSRGPAPAGPPSPHDAGSPALTAALNTGVTELDRQFALSDTAGNYLGTALDNPRWSGIEAPSQAAPWFALFDPVAAALDPASDAGIAISPTERTALLAAPRPNGAGASEVEALLTHLTATTEGTKLKDATYRATLATSVKALATATAARRADGWAFPLDGLKRALLASTQVQQEVITATRASDDSGSGGAIPGANTELPRARRYWVIVNLETGFTQRGQLNAAGRFDPVILSPDAFHLVCYTEPDRGRIGVAYFMSTGPGQTTTIPTALMIEDDFPDSDGDSVSDVSEMVVGTLPNVADSDGDGVPDGAEMANRSNPLDGSAPVLGVVASVETPGTALDVAAEGNLAVVADDGAGMALVDIGNPLAPVLVAQLDLPTNPKAVALSGNRALLASGSRFYVVDISAANQPKVVADVALTGANRVAVAGPLGFVGAGAKLRSLDLATGNTLSEATLPAGIHDLAVTRDLVVVLTTEDLRVFRIDQKLPGTTVNLVPLGTLAVAGGTAPLEDGRRLFAAGARAYAGYFEGFSIIDLSDPTLPKLLAKQPAIQAAVHDLAADGSGRLVTVTSFGGPVSLAVSLYDVQSGDDVTRFLGSWNTPGDARALTLHRGFAFAADTGRGVQTVNYRSADTGTNAPNITLEVIRSAGSAVESGGNLRLIANTSDDVMVREVEFYLDGVRVATDGSLPFEWHGVAPALTAAKSNIVVRARATDTGGNSRWSDEQVIPLADTIPLRVTSLEPVPGSLFHVGTAAVQLAVRFDGPFDPATVNPGTLTLAAAGVDGAFGTTDDVPFAGNLIQDPGQMGLRLTFPAPLPAGRYRATLAASLADLSQTVLGNPVTWDFELRDALLWARDASGLWTAGTNWSTGKVPNRDFVIIDRPVELTVSGTSLNTAVSWLHSEESLALTGSTLRLGEDSYVHGALTLDNSTLVASNRLALSGPVTLRRNSTLDAVTVASGPILVDGGGTKRIRKSVELAGSLKLKEGPLALPAGSLTLAAGSELVFDPANAADATRDVISSGGDSTGTLRNFGAIRHKAGARPLNVQFVNLVNHGEMEATTGGFSFQGGRFDQGPSGRIHSALPMLFNGTSGEWDGTLSFPGGLTVRTANVILRGALDVGAAGLTLIDGDFTVRAPLTLKKPVTSNSVGLHLFETLVLDGATRLDLLVDGIGVLRARDSVDFLQLQLDGSVRLENTGTFWISNRTMNLRGNSVFHNQPNGVVEITNPSRQVSGVSAIDLVPRFLNEGLIHAASVGNLTNSSDDLRIAARLDNTGRIEIEKGRLQLQANTRHSGTTTVAAGAVLRLNYQDAAGGTHAFLPGSVVTGDGTAEVGTSTLTVAEVTGTWTPSLTRIIGGTLRFPGSRQLGRLDVINGLLQLGASLEISERLDWQLGSLSGPGTLRLTGQFAGGTNSFPSLKSGARFELASSVGLDLVSAPNSEPGTLWRILPGAELSVHRTGVFGSGNIFTPSGSFLNEGRLTKGLTNGGLRFLVPLTNAGVITVRSNLFRTERRFVQTAGQFQLDGGTLHLDGGNGGSNGTDSGYGLELDGGDFSGYGIIQAPSATLRPFTNNAVVRPGLPIGRLAFNYVNYAQGAAGVLEIEIGGRTAGTEFDQIVFTAPARVKALAGKLSVKLVNGFEPVIGDRFLVISGSLSTAANRFTTTDLPVLPAGRRWLVNYLSGAAPGVELQVAAGP